MPYSLARVSAAVAMQVEDYFGQGKRWWVRLREKGGKVHEMPCHHNLEAYLHAAGIAEAKKTPLFRSALSRTGELTGLRPILSGPRMTRPLGSAPCSSARRPPAVAPIPRSSRTVARMGRCASRSLSASISRLGRQSRQRLSTDIPP
jgi:hypothetical protein